MLYYAGHKKLIHFNENLKLNLIKIVEKYT